MPKLTRKQTTAAKISKRPKSFKDPPGFLGSASLTAAIVLLVFVLVFLGTQAHLQEKRWKLFT